MQHLFPFQNDVSAGGKTWIVWTDVSFAYFQAVVLHSCAVFLMMQEAESGKMCV